ncbi:MAG TPA: T9SS type A sorting domain-containing protein, partial [Flavipsychrobacter sp.]
MRRGLLLFSFMVSAIAGMAQHARVTKHTATLAGTSIARDVEDKYNAQVINLEAPNPDANIEKKRLRQIKEQSAKYFPRKKQNVAYKTTAIPGPVVEKGFVADSFPGIPPDNDMAISKDGKAVSVVNSSIAVLNGSTGQMTYKRGLKTFSTAAGLNTFNDYRYDPKVMYDPVADKYIVVMLNSTDGLNYIVVAFSESNDPQGKWNFYKFYGNYNNDTTWFDYPAIAMTKDEFFLTGNKIRYNTSWQAGFKETVIYQINKQSGYSGAASLNYQIWDSITYNGVAIRNLYPVKTGSALQGPAQYFLSNRNFDIQNDTIFLVKLPDVIGSGNNNLDIQVLKSPISYGVPPNGRQVDTFELATNDGRILGAFAEGDEIQFVSTSVYTSTGSAGVYHARIDNYKTTPAIAHASIFAIDTLDFGYPNLSFSGNPWGLNQSIISFNYTGPNTYAGIGAITFNGTEYSALVKVKEGDTTVGVPSIGKVQRWGDYMGSQQDWSEYGAVWVEGIYGRKNHSYGNWMAKLNSQLLSVKEKNSVAESAQLYPNPAMQYIQLDFEIPEAQVLNYEIYDMQGKVVDRILSQRTKKGRNRIQFDIASLAAGNYILKATGDAGATVSRSFVKQ